MALLSAAALAVGVVAVPPASAAATPTLKVFNVNVTERDAAGLVAHVPVSVSTAPHAPVTVRYTTANATAKAPADYASRTGTLYFSKWARTKYINVPIVGDTRDEANEYFKVRLSDPFHAAIADGLAIVTIIDNDPLPRLSVDNPVPMVEGNTGSQLMSFKIRLSAPSGRLVTVHYAVTPGSASYGSDYTVLPTTGTRSFNPGATTKYVRISVLSDVIDEMDETVNLSLSAPVNARIADGAAVGTILDDDGPGLRVNNAATVPEGGTAVFTVTITPASPQAVTVNYATAPGTATGADYVATSGTLSFGVGETSKTIGVPTVDDGTDEVNEYFYVILTSPVNATIDDSQGYVYIDDNDGPGIRIDNASAAQEGSSAAFSVTLTASSPETVRVNYATVAGTAGTSDYVTKSGTVTFVPGDTSEPITVATIIDAVADDDEYFWVHLTDPVEGTLSDDYGLSYINDNGTTSSAWYVGSFRGDTGSDYTTRTGNIHYGDTDMYRFEIRESLFYLWDNDMSLHLNLIVPDNGGDLDMCFYNSAGTQLGCSTHGSTTDEALSLGWDDSNSNDTRTFYVKVYGYIGAENSYSLTIGR